MFFIPHVVYAAYARQLGVYMDFFLIFHNLFSIKLGSLNAISEFMEGLRLFDFLGYYYSSIVGLGFDSYFIRVLAKKIEVKIKMYSLNFEPSSLLFLHEHCNSHSFSKVEYYISKSLCLLSGGVAFVL